MISSNEVGYQLPSSYSGGCPNRGSSCSAILPSALLLCALDSIVEITDWTSRRRTVCGSWEVKRNMKFFPQHSGRPGLNNYKSFLMKGQRQLRGYARQAIPSPDAGFFSFR